MHKSEYRVAVPDSVYDDPNGHQVEDLVDIFVLIFHFFEDAVEMLGPAVDRIFDSDLIQSLFHMGNDPLDSILTFFFSFADLLRKIIVGFRLQELESDILQFHLHGVDAQTCGQRRVDIQRLLTFLHDLVVSHVVDRP